MGRTSDSSTTTTVTLAYVAGTVFFVMGAIMLPAAVRRLMSCLSGPGLWSSLLLAYCLAWVAFLWFWAVAEEIRAIRLAYRCLSASGCPGNGVRGGQSSDPTKDEHFSALDREFAILVIPSLPVLIAMGDCKACAGARSVIGTCAGEGIMLVSALVVISVLRIGHLHGRGVS